MLSWICWHMKKTQLTDKQADINILSPFDPPLVVVAVAEWLAHPTDMREVSGLNPNNTLQNSSDWKA